MRFTIKPESPKGTLFLIAALAGVLIWIAAMDGASKSRAAHSSAAPPPDPGQASLLAAIPGSLPPRPRSAEPRDTTFHDDPFFQSEPEPDVEIVEDEAETTQPDFILQGTAVAAGQSMALISGSYCTPGQYIQGWQLVW